MPTYTYKFKVNGIQYAGWKQQIDGEDHFVWYDFGVIRKRKLCVLCSEATAIQEI